jgi:hypothetical protein
MTYMKDKKGNYTKDLVTINFFTVDKGDGTLFKRSQRSTTVTLQTTIGMVVATKTHDNNIHDQTGISRFYVDYLILKGTNYFADKTFLRIYYTNSVGPYTSKFQRRIIAY